jgi:hypothetical protein
VPLSMEMNTKLLFGVKCSVEIGGDWFAWRPASLVHNPTSEKVNQPSLYCLTVVIVVLLLSRVSLTRIHVVTDKLSKKGLFISKSMMRRVCRQVLRP